MGNPNAEPQTVAILDPNGPQTYKSALLWTVALGPLESADRDVKAKQVANMVAYMDQLDRYNAAGDLSGVRIPVLLPDEPLDTVER